MSEPTKSPVAAAVARCRSGLFGVGLFSALMNLLMLTGPFFMMQVYDRVLTSLSLPTLVALSLIAVVLYLFFGAFDYIRSLLLTRLSHAFDREVAGYAFHETTERGQGSKGGGSTPSQDLQQVQQFIASPALATVFDTPWFPIFLVVVFLLHPLLGVIALGGAIALVIIAVLNQVSTAGLSSRSREILGREDRLMLASRRQSETLLAMGMMPEVSQAWRGAREERLASQTRATDRQSIFASSSKTLRLILQSSMLGVGAYLVIGGELSAGAMIAASIIFARALAPLDQSIAQWRSISGARSAYARLKESAAGFVPAQVGTALEMPKKEIVVRDLAVATPDRSAIITEDASFKLEAGDALGIIGPSGCGKSTLVKGLLGIWPVESGDVRFDGATLDQWRTSVRGRIVGYLPQDIELFPGTIAQNIARFRPDASSKSILDAAELADVHSLIVSKPDGFDTVVGPGAHDLSGGERQRIALARAVYGRPFIVVLDEPNASMDAVGEKALSNTIKKLREEGSIVIVITHRTAVLSQVNKLMQIVEGRIVAFGETKGVLTEMRAGRKAQVAGKFRVVD